MSMKLALCTIIYMDYVTLEEAIRRTAKFGFDGIDILADSPHLDPWRKDTEYWKSIKKLANSEGLEICGLALNGGALGRQYNFSYSKDWVRRYTVDYYKKCVDMAQEMGVTRINMFSGHMMSDTTWEQAWKWNFECMKEVSEHAASHGVTACLHTLTPSESRVLVTLDDSLRMLHQINSPGCKIVIDTADQNITDPNLSEAIRKVAKHLAYVHVSDNEGSGLGLVHNIPGEGTIDWEFFINGLRDASYEGWVTAQILSAAPIDPDSWVRKTYRYMSEVMEKCGVRSSKVRASVGS